MKYRLIKVKGGNRDRRTRRHRKHEHPAQRSFIVHEKLITSLVTACTPEPKFSHSFAKAFQLAQSVLIAIMDATQNLHVLDTSSPTTVPAQMKNKLLFST